MDCEHCDGYGYLLVSHRNDPDEKRTRCLECNGTGRHTGTLADYDGLQVRVIDTGFVGTCAVNSLGWASVINEEDEEVEDLCYDDLELFE